MFSFRESRKTLSLQSCIPHRATLFPSVSTWKTSNSIVWHSVEREHKKIDLAMHHSWPYYGETSGRSPTRNWSTHSIHPCVRRWITVSFDAVCTQVWSKWALHGRRSKSNKCVEFEAIGDSPSIISGISNSRSSYPSEINNYANFPMHSPYSRHYQK